MDHRHAAAERAAERPRAGGRQGARLPHLPGRDRVAVRVRGSRLRESLSLAARRAAHAPGGRRRDGVGRGPLRGRRVHVSARGELRRADPERARTAARHLDRPQPRALGGRPARVRPRVREPRDRRRGDALPSTRADLCVRPSPADREEEARGAPRSPRARRRLPRMCRSRGGYEDGGRQRELRGRCAVRAALAVRGRRARPPPRARAARRSGAGRAGRPHLRAARRRASLRRVFRRGDAVPDDGAGSAPRRARLAPRLRVLPAAAEPDGDEDPRQRRDGDRCLSQRRPARGGGDAARGDRAVGAGGRCGASVQRRVGRTGSRVVKPLAELEIWFVAGTQEMYGSGVIAAVEVHAREIAGALDAEPGIPVQVRDRGVALSPESIRRLCLDANADDACVGVVIWMHTFSPAKMWISGLSALRKPLLHLHTQFNRELPWAEIDMDFMNLNQSAHGDRELGFMQTRMGVRRKTVVGHWRDPAVVHRLAAWTRAACGWHELQQLSVARFGDNMRQVAVTEGDKVEAQLRLGVAVNGYGSNELAHAVEGTADADVDALVQEYEERYDLVPALRAGGERRESLRDAARIEAGLRSFLDAGGFKAFTDTFEALAQLRQLPRIGR